MQKEIIEPKPLEEPKEIVNPEGGAFYEQYKKDGVYEYAILANGKTDKSHVKITYHHGAIFEGSLEKGKYVGTGKYVWKDGGFYEGTFEKGKLCGAGIYTAANGDRYEGDFKGNRYNGAGTYTWADGCKFEGEFKNGQISKGLYTDEKGNVYSCSYTYKMNGERKSGKIRLVEAAAAPKTDLKEEHKKESSTVTKKARLEKAGLLNRDATLMTAIRKSVRGAEFKALYSGMAGKDEKSEQRLIKDLSRDFGGKDIIATNYKLYGYIRNGKQIQVRRNGKEDFDFVKLIDYEKPQNNTFTAVSQMWIKGTVYWHRPDVIIFVNGLPLVYSS